MKKFLTAVFFVLAPVSASFAASFDFTLRDTSFVYNGENAAYWEETRTTLTYLENLLDATFGVRTSSIVEFRAGAAVLVPCNAETKIANWYPLLGVNLTFDGWSLSVGVLRAGHDMPSPILDPLVEMTPEVRLLSLSQMPLNSSESYDGSPFTHGMFEKGFRLKWDNRLGMGELYLNWQLADTTNHRERFDAGLTERYAAGPLPLYLCLHYWHNGGHENPHPVTITENYTLAAGFRNDLFSALYLASYLLPDREAHPEENVFGQGLYGSFSPKIGNWKFVFETFVSDAFVSTNHKFWSVEGDPFYRVPFYFGFNLYREFELDDWMTLTLGFVNGTFLPYTDSAYEWKDIRYDQMLKLDFEYTFDLKRRQTNETN